MEIDFDLLNQKINASRNKYGVNKSKPFGTNAFWKPSPGIQTVRLVPYKYYQTAIPFIDMDFYFFMRPEVNKVFLCPASLGHQDPIKEAQQVLFNTGDKGDAEIAKKMNEIKRYYTAVIVRGKELEGVKLWGFSESVFKKIGKLLYGQWRTMLDLNNGYDLTVTYYPHGIEGNQRMATTEVEASIKQTPAFDLNDVNMQNLFNNPPNIYEIFKEPSYDELKSAVEKWLHPDAVSESFENPTQNTFAVINEENVNTNPFLQHPTPQNNAFTQAGNNPFLSQQQVQQQQPVRTQQTNLVQNNTPAVAQQPVMQQQVPVQQTQQAQYQTVGNDSVSHAQQVQPNPSSGFQFKKSDKEFETQFKQMFGL